MDTNAPTGILTFDEVIFGETSHGFDATGDGIVDVVFNTTDPAGFNTLTGPFPLMTYIIQPALEASAVTVTPDLRADFPNGAVGSLSFGFGLASDTETETMT